MSDLVAQVAAEDEGIEAKFWGNVRIGARHECWPWTAARHPRGYGHLWIRRRAVNAHRISWVLSHGEIPDGLSVLHHCDNPPCVNPNHLFLGTQQDNVKDMVEKGRWRNVITEANKAKTQCIWGHDLGNAYVRADGSRQCRECAREYDRRRYPTRFPRKAKVER